MTHPHPPTPPETKKLIDLGLCAENDLDWLLQHSEATFCVIVQVSNNVSYVFLEVWYYFLTMETFIFTYHTHTLLAPLRLNTGIVHLQIVRVPTLTWYCQNKSTSERKQKP